MKLDNLFDYLIPIAIMVLYFFLNARKKKEKPQVQKEEALIQPSPQRKAPPPAPVSRRPQTPHLQIENRKIGPAVKESRFSAAMTEKRRSEAANRKQVAYVPKKKARVSHAGKLLKGTSLRDAFLLKEILNRPYD